MLNGAGQGGGVTVEGKDRRADEIVRRNIALVEQLERAEQENRSRGEQVADRLMDVFGTTKFVWFHVAWFTAWITINSLPGLPHWDRFPFSFLTMTVSLEAIFLTTFILISQKRQSELADQRNKLDLQINLLAEQENSKMIAMLEAISRKLGVEVDDPEVAALATPTHPDQVLNYIKEAMSESGLTNPPDDREEVATR